MKVFVPSKTNNKNTRSANIQKQENSFGKWFIYSCDALKLKINTVVMLYLDSKLLCQFSVKRIKIFWLHVKENRWNITSKHQGP